MENPRPPSLDDAINNLQFNDHFRIVLGELVNRREQAIKDLRDYETDVSLRKHAARIDIYTELLDDFAVPTGTPIPK